MNYYSLGKWIVEVQQQGKHRAEYGKKIIINLSKKLTEEFGKGFSESTLAKARKFYLTYKDRISETLFTEFAIKKSETSYDYLEGNYDSEIFTAEKRRMIKSHQIRYRYLGREARR
uniref:DUF1016 N-terminal domain-containing protein n=1 Tax=Agathobacter rectalis TaxID=39491 RepID=UPI0040278EE9